MSYTALPLVLLAEQFANLPGIGLKSAQRRILTPFFVNIRIILLFLIGATFSSFLHNKKSCLLRDSFFIFNKKELNIKIKHQSHRNKAFHVVLQDHQAFFQLL